MAFTPYSVSPLRTDHRRGPNPTKYSVTFMPAHLAVAKWPSSCSITIATRMAMKRRRSPQLSRTNTAVMSPTPTSSCSTRPALPSGTGSDPGGGGVDGAASCSMRVMAPTTLPRAPLAEPTRKDCITASARLRIGGQHPFDPVDRVVDPALQGLRHDVGDRGPREAAVEERVDRHLVGRVQPGGRRSAAAARLVGEVDAPED